MLTCPRCHVPLPVPTPERCSSCGHALSPGASSLSISRGGAALAGPRLSARTPDGRTTEYPLSPKTTLGRHPANTLRLADREVSKEHAVIELVGNAFVLRDLGSSNGTFVNGRRVKDLRLKDGDEISMGNSRLIFASGDGTPSPAGTAPGVTVVATAQSVPAFLAQLDQIHSNEFRPIEQMTDVAQLRQDYEKLRIAHEFHRQVGLERDLKSLLDKILKVAFQLLAADNGVIFLADPDGILSAEAVLHRHDGNQEVMLSETVLKRVMDTRQAVLTADAIIDSRFSSSESIVAQGIRSAMAVPLVIQDQLKGVLFIDTRERTNAFSEKDLKILSGVAAQAAIALENSEMAQKIEADAVARAELSRFLSPKVAEMVVMGQVEMLREGRLSEVSVLFVDIRGFTSMAETEDPKVTVGMLNEFFTAMSACVFRHEGNLDKFIGDCVMATWGEPQPHPDDPARALRAALEMQDEIDALNRKRVEAGKRPIAAGIGVNTGQAVVGYMGSQERHEFTAIGDSVNTASRLCGIAKGGEVLASEATVRRAGGGFEVQPLPVSQVKGKEKGVVTYRVLGIEQTTSSRSKK